MTSILGVLISRWTLSLIGTALLAVLVWFFAPLLASLEGMLTRLMIALGNAADLAGREPAAR